MKINSYKNYNPAFGAIKIAETKNYLKRIETPIIVYELTQKDIAFLNHLKKLKMKELMPGANLFDYMYEIWQEIFNIAVEQAKSKSHVSLLGVFNNRPCSILNFSKQKGEYKINTICSWPAESDKKVTFAGKTLFSILFKDFLKNNGTHIDIDAVTNAPFNGVSKYMSLGFRQRGGENYILAMRAEKDSIEKTSKILDEFIKIVPFYETEEINLLDILI